MVRVVCRQAGLAVALSAAAVMAVACGGVSSAAAAGGSAQRYSGEIHCYAVSFWLFRNAAVGRLAFAAQKDGTFEAVFEARTAGLLRRIVGLRRAEMKSRMEFDNATRRFRPLRYQEMFMHGDDNRTRTVEYDYRRERFTYTRAGSGGVLGQTSRKLPGGPVEDIFTAFYNLRSGLYGEVSFESARLIPLLVTDRPASVSLIFQPRTSRQPGHDYYAVAQVDPSISQVGARRIRGWLSKALIPVEAVIEDAYFFGSVTLKLAAGHDECTAYTPAH